VFDVSTGTIHKILKPLADLESSRPTLKARISNKDKKGARLFLSGVQRLRRWNGRVDLKVKLGSIANRAKAWFRYILLSGFSDIEKVLESIESGEKPP